MLQTKKQKASKIICRSTNNSQKSLSPSQILGFTNSRLSRFSKKGQSYHETIKDQNNKNALKSSLKTIQNKRTISSKLIKSQNVRREVFIQQNFDYLNDLIIPKTRKTNLKSSLSIQKEKKVKNSSIRLNKAYNPRTSSNLKPQDKDSQPLKIHRTISTNKRKRSIQINFKGIESSPYMNNLPGNWEKLHRMLKPVRGPNESLKNQIKKHNTNSVNLKNHQAVIMRKSNQLFEIKMSKFMQRMGLRHYDKIYIMNSQDEHIKAALNANGWTMLEDKECAFYHLKWTYNDQVQDYENINNGQLFNHFYQNQQLTNKNNLRKNINKYSDFNLIDKPHVPLTFDLNLSQGLKQFHEYCQLFETVKILNLIITQIKQSQNDFYNMIRNQCESKRIQSKIIALKQKINLQHKTENKQIPSTNSKEIEMEISIINTLIKFLVNHQKLKIKGKYTKNQIDNIENQKTTTLTQVRFVLAQQKIKSGAFLNRISELLKVQLIRLQFNLNQSSNLIQSYGTQNAWIIKPSGVSRGAGIFIQNNFHKLISLNQNHGKIIQKYIQKPLIFKDLAEKNTQLSYETICKKNENLQFRNKKFDIRQWVLVRSFQPLSVYVFDKFYCRLCSQNYETSDFNNLQKHLTNYSLFQSGNGSNNKLSQRKIQVYKAKAKIEKGQTSKPNNKRQKQTCIQKEYKTIMLQKQFKDELIKQQKMSEERWIKLKLQINQNILKTLQCCRYSITNDGNCFQLYGFDIMLDENLNNYILEVNLSPACQERQGLDSYLRQMSFGLVGLIEDWIGVNQKLLPYNDEQLKRQQMLFQSKEHWKRVTQSQNTQQLRQINEVIYHKECNQKLQE